MRQISARSESDRSPSALPDNAQASAGIASIFNAVRSRWLSTALLIALSAIAGIALHQLLPSHYQATATVLIGGPQARQPELDSLVISAVLNHDTLVNEVEILQSRTLARRVVERLNLAQINVFSPLPAEAENSEFALVENWRAGSAMLRDGIDTLLAWARQAPEAGVGAYDVDYGRSEMEDLIDRFLQGLKVIPRGRSQVIDVTYRSDAPGLSALIANTLVEEYLADRADVQTDAARLAGSWLRERLEELRRELERRETAVEDYRREAGLLQGITASLSSERLSALNAQLLEARAALAQASGRHEEAVRASASDRNDAMAEVLQSQTIRDLRARENELASEFAQFQSEYGPRHPRMVDLRQRLDETQRSIGNEITRIASSFAREVDIHRQRVEQLEVEVAGVRAQVVDEDGAMARLRILEREAEATRELYQDTLRRAEQASPTQATASAGGRLLSAAAPPRTSTKPRLALLGGMGLLFGCGLALVTAVGRELLDRRFRNVRQAEAQLGLRVLGVIPNLDTLPGHRSGSKPEDTVVIYPGGAFAEAVRALLNQIALRRPADDKAALVLAITSAVQGEGKTMLAVSLARIAALLDQRVLLIDADMRLGRIHQVLQVPAMPGLSDYLAGSAKHELELLCHVDPVTPLKVLVCGRKGYQAGVLLQSGDFRRAIKSLREKYDLIVVDTPPVLPVADFSAIIGVADAALFIVDWSRMRPDVVEAGAERLCNGRDGLQVGVVINNVDVSKKANHAFPELEIYSSRYNYQSQ